MLMQDLLTIERVIPRLKALDKREVIRKLVTHASRDAGVSATAIFRSVLESPLLPAFGPEAGVSLLHAFVPELGSPVASFARLEPAVDFGAADGSQTDLVALLLSSAESTGDHLRALACIARTLRDPNVRNLLRAAKSRDSLYVIMCESEKQHWSREPAFAEGTMPSQA
jgi:PTS system nitrogen regulatory IIA component